MLQACATFLDQYDKTSSGRSKATGRLDTLCTFFLLCGFTHLCSSHTVWTVCLCNTFYMYEVCTRMHICMPGQPRSISLCLGPRPVEEAVSAQFRKLEESLAE